ncbi:MAG: hypothetical protein LLG06_01235 [Desulfobacteraceae bacterium]|nr:hypothetical protein [Desulfobacteraceae bacterium]
MLKTIKIGMEYETSLFQMSETFKTHTGSVVAEAKKMSEKMRHYYSFTEVAYAFVKTADSMQCYGITGARYLQLVERAADSGAAKNLALKDSIDRIESAMRGEAEASEYLGLTLNDTYMKNMAFGGALREVWEKLDDNTKAWYRWHEVMSQSEKYAGAAGRATGTLEGALKSLWGTIKDKLGPALQDLNTSLAAYVNLANGALQTTPLDNRIKLLETRLASMKNAEETARSSGRKTSTKTMPAWSSKARACTARLPIRRIHTMKRWPSSPGTMSTPIN